MKPLTTQSKSRHCEFPGSSIAARDLGVHRAHLHRVLKGERESKTLIQRWNAWLEANPEFANANRRKNSTPA